ncbi:PP2C family protein-serine/threonine phosphatase [Psychromicrobium sp. YIM B11713]|uniref:PP2C family protein-serine/threonine phosphatase n=1 Tax=Psychromicrobium sp. YIM B11713 TaxID=3145233 RepID=UPI00374E40D3
MAGPLILRYAARSDVGKIRAKNDDSAYAGQYLAVVADGMGGHAGGDVASASTVLDLIHLDRDGYRGDAGTILADEIQTANSLLSEMVHVNPKLTGMGTTVTAVLLSEGKLEFAHIGDSRAYRLKDGVFEQISTDHTFVQRLIEEGRLTPEEAETHPHKNVLMRVLGDVDASPELDLTSFEASPGERWLLCSDGLNFVDLPVVEQVFRETSSLSECAEKLIELTLGVGSPDNVTVVVIEVSEASADDLRTDQFEVVPPAEEQLLELPETAVPESVISTAEQQPAAAAAELTEQSSDTPVGTDSPSAAVQSTDGQPLGSHIAADVVREDLAHRPHELVGAAITAAAEGKIPMVAGRSTSRRAAAVLTHKPEQAEDEEVLSSEPPKRRRWFTLAVSALLLVVIVGGAWLGYAWTQTRYYVGEYHGKVAIFNGISQSLGPIQLSRVYTETPVTVDSLPEFSRQRLAQTLAAATLTDANQIVSDLQLGIVSPPGSENPSPSSKPSSSPSGGKPSSSPSSCPSSGSAKPSGSASPSATGNSSASPDCKGGRP